MNSVAKGLLGKLMARENIEIIHDINASTASFNIKDRVLRLPVWKDMNSNLYDLLIGHEVGHALFTPLEGWHDAVVKNKHPNFKYFLNVVEDARIEKRIQRKYPGLVNPFKEAYANLIDRGFFGEDVLTKINSMSFIDRLNVHCKVDNLASVTFVNEEIDFLQRTKNIETFEEVYQLACDIWEYSKDEQTELNMMNFEDMLDNLEFSDESSGKGSSIDIDDLITGLNEEQKEKLKEKLKEKFEEHLNSPKSNSNSGPEDSDINQDGLTIPSGKSSGSSSSSDSPKDSSSSDSSGSIKDSVQSESKESPQESPKESSDTLEKFKEELKEEFKKIMENHVPTSETDQKFREKEKELVTVAALPYVYLNCRNDNYKKLLVSYEKFKEYSNIAWKYTKNNEEDYQEFLRASRSYVNSLVKEFEMRKSATKYKNTKYSDTGELNISRLPLMNITDDIFLKKAIVPQGKSHGLVMLLDWSHSMFNFGVFHNSVKQAINLAMFCKKVQIPFVVYGFSSNSYLLSSIQNREQIFERHSTIFQDNLALLELISSDFNNTQFEDSLRTLYYVGNTKSTYYNVGHMLRLSGTPLNISLMFMPKIIEDLRQKHSLDIVNLIMLTDGESDGINAVFDGDGENFNPRHVNIVFHDKKVGFQKVISRKGSLTESVTNALSEYIKKSTGANVIGYRVCRYIPESIHRFIDDKKFRQDGFYHSDREGFDSFMFVKSDDIYGGDVEDIPDDYSNTKIKTAFKNIMRKRKFSRPMISHLAKLIS